MIYRSTLFAITLAGGVATAGTVHGDLARHLTNAVHYAGSTPTVKKRAHTYQLAAADCIRTVNAAGALSEYKCTLGKTSLEGPAAYLLYTSLEGAGVGEVPIGDTQIEVSAKTVSCTFDDSLNDHDLRYTCTGDALSSKPEDVKITPLKKKPVKDIVQPVKIEKQEKQ